MVENDIENDIIFEPEENIPNLTVRNIAEEDYTELQQEAREDRRSVNAELQGDRRS